LDRFFPPFRYTSAKSEISTFRQGANKPLCETWEQFKTLLRKCPKSWLLRYSSSNGLKPQTKIILDAAVGGTMMHVDTKQASRITYAMASTKYQDQHSNLVKRKDCLIHHSRCHSSTQQDSNPRN